MYNVELPPSVPCAPLRNVGTPPRETANEKPLGISWQVPRPHFKIHTAKRTAHGGTETNRRGTAHPNAQRCAKRADGAAADSGRGPQKRRTDPPPLPPPQSRSPAGHMLLSTRPPARREQQRPGPAEHMLLSTRPPARPVRCMTHSAKAKPPQRPRVRRPSRPNSCY